MWDLPGPGIEPVSPATAGGFLTTVPPGKSIFLYLMILFVEYPLLFHRTLFSREHYLVQKKWGIAPPSLFCFCYLMLILIWYWCCKRTEKNMPIELCYHVWVNETVMRFLTRIVSSLLHIFMHSCSYYPWMACYVSLWVIAFIHLFIQQIFNECQLFARHCAGHSGLKSKQHRHPSLWSSPVKKCCERWYPRCKGSTEVAMSKLRREG